MRWLPSAGGCLLQGCRMGEGGGGLVWWLDTAWSGLSWFDGVLSAIQVCGKKTQHDKTLTNVGGTTTKSIRWLTGSYLAITVEKNEVKPYNWFQSDTLKWIRIKLFFLLQKIPTTFRHNINNDNIINLRLINKQLLISKSTKSSINVSVSALLMNVSPWIPLS